MKDFTTHKFPALSADIILNSKFRSLGCCGGKSRKLEIEKYQVAGNPTTNCGKTNFTSKKI
jgi:hypothetical protein